MSKKEEPDLNNLDISKLSQECVASSRLGRTLASFGATLTGKEKHDAALIYALISAGKTVSKSSPVVLRVIQDSKPKKYSPSEAIKWFVEKYPREAQPLLKKLEETYQEPITELEYGLKDKRDLDYSLYVNILIDVLHIPRQDAAVMYHGVIMPQLERLRKQEGLVKIVMK